MARCSNSHEKSESDIPTACTPTARREAGCNPASKVQNRIRATRRKSRKNTLQKVGVLSGFGCSPSLRSGRRLFGHRKTAFRGEQEISHFGKESQSHHDRNAARRCLRADHKAYSLDISRREPVRGCNPGVHRTLVATLRHNGLLYRGINTGWRRANSAIRPPTG